jgi:hypothetical protein
LLRVVTQNGIIYAKQTKESPSIKIQSIDQINNLLAYHKPHQHQLRAALHAFSKMALKVPLMT